MAHKTFISYKYSEAQYIRDIIIEALGDDASYYRGETSDSPDMTDYKTDSIKRVLSDMIYSTSVIIVVITQHVDSSEWIKWEIEYATGRSSREGRQSQNNGVVVVYDDNRLSECPYNRTMKLIYGSSDPVVVPLSVFLNYSSEYIDMAYKKSKGIAS